MELLASAAESVRPEDLALAGRAVSHPPAHGRAFDALTWLALRLGRLGPVRRAIARHMEARIRARGELSASALRHPPAVEQDKIALALGALGAAERGLRAERSARRRCGRCCATSTAASSCTAGDERQGPLPRAPRPEPGRLPGDQPGQGVQPALRRLLRQLRRPPRASRLGDLRAHGARRLRDLGHAGVRDQRRGAPRLARRQPLLPRPRRALPGLLLHHVHERDADRRRGREAPGPHGQREPGPVHRGDEGAYRRPPGRRCLRQGPRGHGAAEARGRHHRRLPDRHPPELGRDPLRRGGRDLLRPDRRELRLRLPLHADRALVHARPHDDAGAAAAALRAGLVAGAQPAPLHRRLLELGDGHERLPGRGAGGGLLPRQLERRREPVRLLPLLPGQREGGLRARRDARRGVGAPLLRRHPELAAGVRLPRGERAVPGLRELARPVHHPRPPLDVPGAGAPARARARSTRTRGPPSPTPSTTPGSSGSGGSWRT